MLTLMEGVPLVIKATGIVNVVEGKIASMPPKAQRTAVDYAKMLGCEAGGPMMLVAELFDETEAAIKS